MSKNNNVILECYVDSCLIEVLLFAGKNHVNHQKGNGTVAKKIKDNFLDSFCLGILDEDRRNLYYLNEFDLINETFDLKLFKHKSKHHYIIQIRPVIEQWILNICDRAAISLIDFGLPHDLNALKKVSKSISAKNDLRFIRLFKKMINENCETLSKLKNWIKYLTKENYNADINYLRNA